MTTCYECEQHAPLVYKSRCGECVIRRLKFNENENEELREQVAQLQIEVADLEIGVVVLHTDYVRLKDENHALKQRWAKDTEKERARLEFFTRS